MLFAVRALAGAQVGVIAVERLRRVARSADCCRRASFFGFGFRFAPALDGTHRERADKHQDANCRGKIGGLLQHPIQETRLDRRRSRSGRRPGGRSRLRRRRRNLGVRRWRIRSRRCLRRGRCGLRWWCWRSWRRGKSFRLRFWRRGGRGSRFARVSHALVLDLQQRLQVLDGFFELAYAIVRILDRLVARH